MIVRPAQLSVVTKDFAKARANLEAILSGIMVISAN